MIRSHWTVALLLAGTLQALRAQSPAPARAGDADGLPDRRDLERFVDSAFAAAMTTDRLPGGAFCFVTGDRVYFCKGYGVADVRTRRPVSPESTIFRVGSISKVFTATALVQLAERGRIDLNVDVNRYLRLQHFEHARLRDELRDALLTRYYRAARERLPVPPPPADFKSRIAEFLDQFLLDPAVRLPVKEQVLAAAGELPDASELAVLYRRLTEPRLRAQVIALLAARRTDDAVDALVDLASRETDAELRARAIDALRTHPSPKARQAAARLVKPD